MLRRIPDRNIWLIYATIFVLGLAYGVALSVLAVFLDARGVGKVEIGWLASVFALGIASFALPAGMLIRRFSARTTLIASLAGYSIAVAVFPFLHGFPAMAAVRFFDGAFSVCVWVSCETILLSRADDRNKAFVTSLYAISLALGYVVGPGLSALIVALAPKWAVFVVAGALAAVASLLVLARLDADVATQGHGAHAGSGEHAPSGSQTPGLTLLWRIKTSCLATFSYGYFQASVVVLLPLFLMKNKGVTEQQSILLPAFFAAGMLLFSNVAGRLGDRFGHLRVMTALAAIGTPMVVGFVFLDGFVVMCVAVFIAGATLATLSPVSLALQGVIVEPRDYSRSNSIYNVFYAAGMLVGPPLSSRIDARVGGAQMLYHLAALWTGFIIFTLVFRRDDPARQRGGAAAMRRAESLSD